MSEPEVAGLEDAVAAILSRLERVPRERAGLVAISGIDGSGKGFVAERLAASLSGRGRRVGAINVDGWLHLPDRRFSRVQPGEHFYANGFRFQEMFEKLVLPLRQARSLDVEADLADATGASVYRRHRYRFADVDVILLEGIFLFKRELRDTYDFSLWIECSFETALERALARGQEGLPPAAVIHDYETTYFAAQRIHLARDDPRAAADRVVANDPRLAAR